MNPRASGESIIERTEHNYIETQRMSPDGGDPHQILMSLYIARMPTYGKNPEEMRDEAFAKTVDFACLPFPQNARALGITFVNSERPDIMDRYPDFAEQYSEYMRPVCEAQERGTCEQLYRKNNPNMDALIRGARS